MATSHLDIMLDAMEHTEDLAENTQLLQIGLEPQIGQKSLLKCSD
jgi:hypothetical protein